MQTLFYVRSGGQTKSSIWWNADKQTCCSHVFNLEFEKLEKKIVDQYTMHNRYCISLKSVLSKLRTELWKGHSLWLCPDIPILYIIRFYKFTHVASLSCMHVSGVLTTGIGNKIISAQRICEGERRRATASDLLSFFLNINLLRLERITSVFSFGSRSASVCVSKPAARTLGRLVKLMNEHAHSESNKKTNSYWRCWPITYKPTSGIVFVHSTMIKGGEHLHNGIERYRVSTAPVYLFL